MKINFTNPDLYLHWIDIALALFIYVFAIILFLKHKRGPITPLLVFGLFVFPIVFAHWFLSDRLILLLHFKINPLEIFYLLFLKFCVFISLVLSRR